MSLQAFVPTHLVPAGGLAAYERADPSASVVAQLEPNLDVAVLERLGDWSHIACSNGWGAWVDGRRLVPRAASSTASTPTPMPLSPALAGAGIIAIGALLPWVRGAAMATGNAFHLPVSMLWSSPRSTTNGPFDLWLLLAAAVVVGAVGCFRLDGARLRRAAGVGVIAVAGLFVVWLVRFTNDPLVQADLLNLVGIGPPIVAGGGILLAFGKAAQ